MRKGFTLIELLIVVAIIAILAAIAVPNFLEAQTRSKVSRCKADMRTLATAIEAYAVDHNAYPSMRPMNSQGLGFTACTQGFPGSTLQGCSVWYFANGFKGVSSRFLRLTTPVSYITSVFRDPFVNESVMWALRPESPPTPMPEYDTYDYVEAKSLTPGGNLGGTRGAAACSGASWHVVGTGPDRINAYGGGPLAAGSATNRLGCDYDPSNGTISPGDIVRVGGPRGPLPGTEVPAYDRVLNKYN